VFIGDEQIGDGVLGERLAAIARRDPPQIFLRADQALDYGDVMQVLGELNRAGLNKVALVSVGDER
jgi:biopolymer transport protein TolR